MIFAEFAEHERRAHVGEIEELLGSVAHFLKEPFAGFDSQNEESEGQLKADSPEHGLQANSAAIGRKDVCETQDHANAEDSCESSHAFLLCACAERRTRGRASKPNRENPDFRIRT